MDLVSSFRERQLQMQDKQRDLQLTMDGPDWPKEDWPLTTADAKHVGEAEHMIQSGLAVLNEKLGRLGGLSRAHESGDETVLEQLAALSEMMSGYVELIDKHVATVKRMQRGKHSQERVRTKAAPPSKSQTAPSPLPTKSLRDQLLNFGSAQTNQEQPFAWLKNSPSVSSSLPIGTPFVDSFKRGESAVGVFDGSDRVSGRETPTAISGTNVFGTRHVPVWQGEWSAAVPVYNSLVGNPHTPEL